MTHPLSISATRPSWRLVLAGLIVGLSALCAQASAPGQERSPSASIDSLILIDGKEATPSEVAELSLERIKRKRSLSPQEATALYGERGGHGAVVVETKRVFAKAPKLSSLSIAMLVIDGQVASLTDLGSVPPERQETNRLLRGDEAVALYGEGARPGVLVITTKQGVTEAGDKIYDEVDQAAKFPGGEEAWFEFLQREMHYPEEATPDNSAGRVFLSLIIDQEGKLHQCKVANLVHPSLAQEALRLVGMMPRWTPALVGGQPVYSRQMISIAFWIEEEAP